VGAVRDLLAFLRYPVSFPDGSPAAAPAASVGAPRAARR
jgi:hypothetical protein